MNVVVLGAGAVGGYFGGKLAAVGVPVTFLVRERRYEQLSAHGLVVESRHGNFTVAPQLALSASEIDHPDIVIVALKNYHLEGALPQIRALVDKGALVLPLLNGVSHIDTLVHHFGANSVVGGACYIEATLDTEGHVVHTSPMHDIIFGTLSGKNHPLLSELEAAFQACGVPARQSSSILIEMWQKFIFLTSFSGITAATRKPIGDVLSDPVTRPFLNDLVREIESVAKAAVNLSENAFEQVMNKLSSVSPSMTSSLHRDLEKGLPLEIDSLQGAVLALAERHGISVPSVRSVYAVLHPSKDGSRS
ncbi:ketopantoate reductase family protein [Alicyclobacillus ferrooxydans]|uniref:2-dehydropantoate 2-reductase n=1 Tax=Alicyclobacillus ferrooxydans TaxID=471514 RepID=A0A0P9CRZ5_9BACL|nr:ketopantoate reductase family protein [Alicyclobacillus ferrooxydans]KPV45577.1 hypothetical protein AN477_01215 [Alicyclobacillus ferrooxydans]